MQDRSEVLNFCVAQLAVILDVDARTIAPAATFSSLGLDSAMAVHLVLAVEEKLGIELYPSVTEDYPDLDSFCSYLASR